ASVVRTPAGIANKDMLLLLMLLLLIAADAATLLRYPYDAPMKDKQRMQQVGWVGKESDDDKDSNNSNEKERDRAAGGWAGANVVRGVQEGYPEKGKVV
ncbi:hypothetical protein KC343_g6944, partial [Hortaea werneckii]